MKSLMLRIAIVLAIVLIVLPEPITTGVGVALLGWAIVHLRGGLWRTHGSCGCDVCRYGLTSGIAFMTPVNNCGPVPPLKLTHAAALAALRKEHYRRAQATLPLLLGRDRASTHDYFKVAWGRW